MRPPRGLSDSDWRSVRRESEYDAAVGQNSIFNDRRTPTAIPVDKPSKPVKKVVKNVIKKSPTPRSK